MSNRYKKIFELPHNLYCEGSPAVICAGALTLDNQNNEIIVQLKIKNISPKNIIAAYVRIQAFSVSGEKLGEPITHSYLDLNVSRCNNFGGKTPVILSDSKTRAFKADLTKVVFEDNSVAEITGNFEPIPVQKSLKEIYSDNQIRDFIDLCNSDCSFEPCEYKDLRICACGEFLHSDENICPACKADFNVISNADPEQLEKNGIYSLACQKIAEAQKIYSVNKPDPETAIKNSLYFTINLRSKIFVESKDINDKKAVYSSAAELFRSIDGWKDSAEKAEFCEKNIEELDVALKNRYTSWNNEAQTLSKKLTIVSACIAALLLITSIASSLNKNYFTPLSEYKEAVSLAEEGDYSSAYSILEELGDFKDSPEKIIEIKKTQAQEYLEKGAYEKAYSIFNEIGDDTSVYESKLQRGKKLIAEEKYDDAYELLNIPYKPAAEEVKKSKYTRGKAHLAAGEFKEAYKLLESVYDYEDSAELINGSKYSRAIAYLAANDYQSAYKLLDEIPSYKDAKAIVDKSRYDRAVAALAAEDFSLAYGLLEKCPDYLDSKKILNDSSYTRAEEFFAKGDYKNASDLYENVDASFYPDAAAKGETANQIVRAQKYFKNGKYKDALEICEKIENNKDAKELAEKCRTNISKIEAYCGDYHTDYYGKDLIITVKYNHNTGVMDFYCNLNHSYREGSANFDVNNPGKKLIYKSYGNEKSYYYRFSGNKLICQLHETDTQDVFTKKS